MKTASVLVALSAALLLPSAAVTAKVATKAPAKAAAKAPADWTKTFSVTPEGGFRVGNPKAKVAIVEYASLTCPHCRHFAETAMKPLLEDYVRTGKASYEFRSFILNGPDLAATLVARCNGPSHFFPMAETLYATQDTWLGRMETLTQADKDKLKTLPEADILTALAKVTGIIPIAASKGISPARAQACLRDSAATNRLAEMYKKASDDGIKGTPTFFVNGQQAQAFDWATLEPFLKAAAGG
jgi:protein-disulfide isomerase